MFSDDDVIHAYTTDQAISDGFLVHPFPERWPYLLITPGVHAICEQQEDRTYEQALVPLLHDCIMEVQRVMKTAELHGAEADFAELEYTVCGTVWIRPNDRGGMTVMLPSEY